MGVDASFTGHAGGAVKVVRYILGAAGALLPEMLAAADRHRRTALAHACLGGHLEAAQVRQAFMMLLANMRSSQPYTPLTQHTAPYLLQFWLEEDLRSSRCVVEQELL
jgi:hypothetical protein